MITMGRTGGMGRTLNRRALRVGGVVGNVAVVIAAPALQAIDIRSA
jgi:hypothetical protein